MIRDSRLSGDDHVVLHLHAPGDSRQCHDQAARADAYVMGDVYEVVDLGAGPDHGIVHTAPVDARVRPDLDVIPDETAPDVRNLAVRLAVLAGDVAETVAAKDRARVHDHPFAERRARVERDAGIELRVIADGDAVPEHARRPDAYVAPELHLMPDDGMRPDRDRLLPRRLAADDRRRMDARFP